MSTIIVNGTGEKKQFSFDPGDNLLEILRAHGENLPAPCGGQGRCGKCLVRLAERGVTKTVLACCTVPAGDCEVWMPEEQSDPGWNEAQTQLPLSREKEGLGAAVDLGTTTVAVRLYDRENGICLGSASRWNAQKSCGADVISRIGYCMEQKNGLQALSGVIRQQITEMILALCRGAKQPFSGVKEIFLAGNTVMQHLFAGISPESIAKAPFLPATRFEEPIRDTLEGVPVRYAPCVAGYVGGDITAGLLALGLHHSKENALFLDVGTNGEMALGGADGWLCCAVASGPAFEGAEMECGMPAAEGAINRVDLTEDGLSYQVIGGGEPQGICGSGLLDLVACLLELGWIDESGFLEPDEAGRPRFSLTETVYLTQRDIRQLQLAKAAVAAGIRRLTEQAPSPDVLYLAGGFGNRLRPESAIRIGMLPKELRDCIVPAGNTSLAGAEQALCSETQRLALAEIQRKCRYLELSEDALFEEYFTEEMCFPEVEE